MSCNFIGEMIKSAKYYWKPWGQRNFENIMSNFAVNTVTAGPRLNIKDRLSRYGDSHVKDKTAGRTSYL